MRKPYFIFMIFILLGAPHALAQGDATKGEKVFRKCRACHMVGDKARNLVGPSLNNVVGGEIAAFDGFKYSKALIKYAQEHKIWSPALLEAYLTNPRQIVKGGRMAFVGLRRDSERKDVIAYLQKFSP